MNILTRFAKVLENKLKEHFSKYLINPFSSFDKPFSTDSYTEFVEQFDTLSTAFTKDAYEAFILSLDDDFMNSTERKLSYTSKGFVTKQLLTKFGWINFKRRRYIDSDGKTFMFIDKLFELTKYKRFDQFVIADLCEQSSTTSYSNAGRIVSNKIGSKVKYNDDETKDLLSRATVRNNVLSAVNLINPQTNNQERVIQTINIMIDEKFVGSQFNDNKDHMVKSAVIYESTSLEYNNRIRLTGKKVFASIDGNIQKDVMDYIYYNYNTDSLKSINIMGDGATWIKSFATDSSFKFNPELSVIYGLDHFHFAQALRHITTNKNLNEYNLLYEYVKSNNMDDFNSLCESFIELNKSRESIIREKMSYIINNWIYIQNTFHVIKFKCSMESNISHVLADLFTSRPKAYSTFGLKSLLKLRLLKVNGEDIQKTYLKSLNEGKKKEITEDITNRNISNHKSAKYVDMINHSLSIPNLALRINNFTV